MTEKHPGVRATAALGGIAAVLGALVVVTNQLPEAPPPADVSWSADGSQLPLVRGNHAAINEYFRQHAPFMDPVPLGGPVAVNGDPGRLLSSGSVSPAAIGLRAEVLLELVFTVPAHFRPARLILSLKLGSYYPYAQWNLPSSR